MGMNAKDLKNLSRGDLLELLLAQTERVEELEQEHEILKKQVETKDILIAKSGTLAEAALAINQVFQAADQAATQYLSNVMRLCEEQLKKNAELEREYAQKFALLAGETTEDEAATAQTEPEELPALESIVNTEGMDPEVAAKCETMLKETSAKCKAMLQEATAQCRELRQQTQRACAEAEQASQAKCREMEAAAEAACAEMKEKASKQAAAYKEKAYAEIAKYVASNGEIKDLLKAKG